MRIVHHVHLGHQHHGGETEIAAADGPLGIHQFEVRMSRLEPGAYGPQRRHGGELVVIVVAGQGKLLIDGGPQRFAAPCTVLIPPDTLYQFANNGTAVLEMVVVFTQEPQLTDGAGSSGPAA